MPTPPTETNRLRTILTACLVLLLVGSGAMAASAQTLEKTWCFEDQLSDEWTIQTEDVGTIELSTDRSTCGDQSLKHTLPGDADLQVRTIDEGVVGQPSEGFNLSVDMYITTSGSLSQTYYFGIVDDSGSSIQVQEIPGGGDGGSHIRGSLVDDDSSGSIGSYGQWYRLKLLVNETHAVYYVDGSEQVTADINGSFGSPSTTKVFIRGQNFGGGSGTDVHYTDNVTLSNYQGTDPDETPDKELRLILNEFMPPDGGSQTYEVRFTENNSTTVVTDDTQTSVSSNNTSVIVVEENVNRLTATSDENVSDVVAITANFTDDDGEFHTTTENVTVAQPTMKNFKILPSSWRINALFSFDMGSGDSEQDTLPLIILISIFAGGITARVVSSFAGIGAMLLVIIVGWFGGWVGEGVVLSALFVGLFIGFNLAANIDYAVRR